MHEHRTAGGGWPDLPLDPIALPTLRDAIASWRTLAAESADPRLTAALDAGADELARLFASALRDAVIADLEQQFGDGSR